MAHLPARAYFGGDNGDADGDNYGHSDACQMTLIVRGSST